MRIAIDAAPLLGHPTGVGVFASGLVHELARSDAMRVDAYALSGRGASQLAALLPPGIGHIGSPMPARLLMEVWRHFHSPVIERWTGPVDVVHGTNFVVPPTKSAAPLVTVHDLTAIRYPELCTSTTLKYPALIRMAIERGAHVHVMTAAIGTEVREHFLVDADRVHVIAPGISEVAVTAPEKGAPYILAVGTIEPRKNYSMLIAAFDAVAEAVPDVQLKIAGARGWGSQAFDDALSQSRFSDRIMELGRVDELTRASLLCNASVLAYPSVYEGFGLPPLEAMSVGTPVVATDIAAVREVCGDAALLVPQGDSDAMARALIGVLTQSGVREGLSASGAALVKQYSWARSAAAMTDLYQYVAESSQ